MITHLKNLRKNEYFQTVTVILLIVAVVLGFWFGSQTVLNTKITPVLAVVSGSMCIPYDGACEGWRSIDHPFSGTLHKGDLIVIQGVDPKTLNANYSNSDIIVFHRPGNPSELIVHRIAYTEIKTDGKLYFYTKGDGNPPEKWPTPPTMTDPWGAVSEDAIEGKVIMRIPWIGYIAISMRNIVGTNNNFIVPIVILLLVLLIIIEFNIPLLRRKQPPTQHRTDSEGYTISDVYQVRSPTNAFDVWVAPKQISFTESC